MIILDEAIHGASLAESVTRWYTGRVVSITRLRLRTVIKDEAVPALLRSVAQPTFVTLNVSDFWRIIPADTRYAVVCVELSTLEARTTLSPWLRRLFSLPEFKTKSARMDKVVRLKARQIAYYETDRRVRTLSWPD